MSAQGSTVFLPISVEGALFALGDIHASVGDGEITSAEVTVKVQTVKGQLFPRPHTETGDSIITCGNAPSFQEARESAVKDMVAILTKK